MKKKVFLYSLLVVLAVATCIGACLVGAVSLSFGSLSEEERTILFSMRMPRVLLGFFAGAGLAVCGVVYQALFRNPLASPYTLGISSGAALFASWASIFAASAMQVSLAGCIGALCTVLCIVLLTRSVSTLSPERLLLSGVMISFFFSSLILFTQYLGDFTAIVRLTRWLMGSVETVGFSSLVFVGAAVAAGSLVSMFFSEELSLLCLGSDIAHTKGVSVYRTIWILFAATSLMVGVIVSICGPIGFIGVAVPLMVRGAGLFAVRDQLPSSFLVGGVLVVLCDAFGRSVIAPAEIPVGVISALIGAPIVIVLITKIK